MSEHDEPRPDDLTHELADDLAEWADDDLVRALRAPGSATELSQELEYAGLFREAGPAPAPVPLARRSLRRLGTGGTAIVVAMALGGGVAAAYTGNLPDPMQDFAHSVIGAPAPDAPEAADPAPATPTRESTSESPSPTPRPSATPTPSSSLSPSPTPTKAAATSAPPSTSATPTPTESPSSAPAPVRAAAASIDGGAHLTAYGSTLRITGRLTDAAGHPVTGQPALLQTRRPDGWVTLARVTSDGDGRVGADSAPVTGLAGYRWRARGVASSAWRVRVRAALAASASVGDRQTTISATTVGGSAGDKVALVTRIGGEARVVARATLAADGTVSFTFRNPARRRAFVVVLAETRDHTAARDRVVVVPPAGRGSQPSDQPSGQPSEQPSA